MLLSIVLDYLKVKCLCSDKKFESSVLELVAFVQHVKHFYLYFLCSMLLLIDSYNMNKQATEVNKENKYCRIFHPRQPLGPRVLSW
jgi:hypothetical protein